MKSTRVATAAICSLFIIGANIASATVFTLVTNQTVAPLPTGLGIHGIAKVGNEWFVANFNSGWNEYNLSFTQTGTTTTSSGTGETRGLVLNSNTGNLFIGDIDTNTIYEVNQAGVVQNSFASGGTSLNALAFNPNSNSLFAVHFGGEVRELTTAGGFINSFNAIPALTGAAFDSLNNSLLLLDSTNDIVREYSPAGLLIATPLGVDAVSGNGQGLHYDSQTGFLHVTGQSGTIGVWQRSVSSVPDSAGILSLLSLSLLGLHFLKRKCCLN